MALQTPIQEILDKFHNVSLFKGFKDDSEALGRMAELFTVERHGAGSAVVNEGESGDAMYIIKSGAVEIVKKTMQGDSYTVAELSADKNSFFGEMALIDPDRRSASVLCKSECEFYVLTRERFLQLGNTHPAIGLALTRELATIVCNRLRKANSDVITLFDALVGEVVESGGLE